MLSVEASNILAVCVLAALGLALGGSIVLMMRRSPFSPVQSFLYALNYTIARVLWRATIRGRFPIPHDQGAVIVCNHRCPLDPSFISITVLRAVHWMVAREYCEVFGLGKLLEICGSIPVGRGGVDTAATRAVIRIAAQGGLVGIFPEARINTTEQTLLPSRSGAALIALKARVPILPCYIHGAPYDGTTLGCFLMPAHVRLVIGQPIDLTPYYDRDIDRETLEEITRLFLTAIAKLAGDDNFQPQLAGRLPKLESL